MIYAKLLEFQKKNIKIERDATNPHFRSSYSSLNEVLDKVKGPLNELGVVIVQLPANEYHAEHATPGLKTELIDTEDDTRASCFVPFVGATDMQKLGGAITYARRYSLVTLLGLEDEDDDGNAASAPASKSASVPSQPRVVRTPAPGPVGQTGEPFAGDELATLNYD